MTKYGTLTVFAGPMFAGKSTHLLAALKRATYAKKRVALYKPSIDTRSGDSKVVTHDNVTLPAYTVSNSWEMTEYEPKDVVGIDEAQFFDSHLPNVVHWMRLKGCDVVVACLDNTSNNEPFGTVPELMAAATTVHKLKAVCVVCGADATNSYRKAPESDTVMIGGADKYEARCYPCWSKS